MDPQKKRSAPIDGIIPRGSATSPVLPSAKVNQPGSARTQADIVITEDEMEKLDKAAAVNAPAPKHKQPHRRRRIALSIIGVVLIAAVAVGAWDAWQLYHKVNHLAVGNLTPSVNGDENILVAGSTNRCLKYQNATWGFCTSNLVGDINSDVIFVVHLNPKTKDASILSIPRDTFIPNARSGNQAFKIDAALYQGPTQLVKAVEEDFGIPIQHYAEVNFDGFVNIVNALGGVKMYFPMPVYDAYSHLDITTPGCKLLNGVEALEVVRARHVQYKPASVTTNNVNYWPQEAESDIARITRTHEFLRVLASAVLARGLSNPISDQKLVDALAPQIQVDNGLSVTAMLQLLEAFHGVNINSMPQLTLPVATTNFGNYYYQDYNYGDVVFPSAPQDQSSIDQFLGISSGTNPLNDKPFPAPSTIKVNVVNGSGTAYQATGITDELSSAGFNMVGQPGSATPNSAEAQETEVIYGSAASESEALAVASKLSGYVILDQDSALLTSGSSVTVLTGTDTAVIGASSSASSSSTPAASTSTSSNALAAPTSAQQALAPWDPRQCPKS